MKLKLLHIECVSPDWL